MAGSRKTRAEAGEGLVVDTVAMPAVRVRIDSERNERRSLLLLLLPSMESADDDDDDDDDDGAVLQDEMMGALENPSAMVAA